VSVPVGLPVVRAVAQVRQPERAVEQARRHRAAQPDGIVSNVAEPFDALVGGLDYPMFIVTAAAGGLAWLLIAFVRRPLTALLLPPRTATAGGSGSSERA